jgi:hypothetical protein
MFAGTGKRKAQGLKSTRNVNPKTISEDDDDDFTDDRAPARARSEQSEFAPTEVDEAEVEEADTTGDATGDDYASLKAMADADHNVSNLGFFV